MNRQSTIIFGVLIFAFIVYITMRGDLPKWFALFKMQGQHLAPSASGGSSGGKGGSTLGTIAGIGGDLVGLIPGGSAISGAIKGIGGLLGKIF